MPSQTQPIVKAYPGTFYVRADESQTVQTWEVGNRYELLKVLGEGSFSTVCLAQDVHNNTKVALKRVGDVLASIDNAKRVLRECAILRRLRHPGIVGLLDMFLQPSSTGKLVFRGGQLVPINFDLYMALEYCDQGDLFHLRGQLSEFDVMSIMWQLLEVLRYLHCCDVWHRDLKSANILLRNVEGRRVAKLCDFGSARSAAKRPGMHGNTSFGRLTRPSSEAPNKNGSNGGLYNMGSIAAPESFPAHTKSSEQLTGAVSLSDLYARPSGKGRGGFVQPLTRAVCTPCYRAPEVIMSHGDYSNTLDMWSLGCVFGELLQRVSYVGKSSTPYLQVAPVVAVAGEAPTPKEGERYEGPGNQTTCQELAALFAMVGTPAWGTIDAVVKHPAWRAYLQRTPGRPSMLYARFAAAGSTAVDLMSRLLEFDPARRASAEEAMEHAYFDGLKLHMEAWEGDYDEDSNMQADQAQGLEDGEDAFQHLDSVGTLSTPRLQPSGTQISDEAVSRHDTTDAMSDVVSPSVAGVASPFSPCSNQLLDTATLSKVLATLENELEEVVGGIYDTGKGPNQQQQLCDIVQQRLKALLERECEELAKEMKQEATAEQLQGGAGFSIQPLSNIKPGGSSGTLSEMDAVTPMHVSGTGDTSLPVISTPATAPAGMLVDSSQGPATTVPAVSTVRRPARPRRVGRRLGVGFGMPHLVRREGLKPDPGVAEDPSQIAQGRLPHHRDAEQAGLLPEQHLRVGRHQEWVPTSLVDALLRGHDTGTWGVSIHPPTNTGDAAPDPGLLAAIRQQQAR